eukprot:353021-Chlamydomonas_euryale.AAC.6
MLRLPSELHCLGMSGDTRHRQTTLELRSGNPYCGPCIHMYAEPHQRHRRWGIKGCLNCAPKAGQ